MQTYPRTARQRGKALLNGGILLLGMGLSTLAGAAPPAFTLFESGQVRPLALAPDGHWLFAINTPDNRLEVFHITGHGLEHRTSVPVGLEPVAVAARSATEVWVVNHLSDSISVVALDHGGHAGRVVRTLLVGDEPRDIVFAGPGHRRAFITTAHRGQNVPYDPQLTTPGVGRADVWVFDADHLGSALGGEPLTIVTLFTDTPRALAVTPDGSQVYAAGFHTGNRTASISELNTPDGFGANGALGPTTNIDGYPAPEVGLIVKSDGLQWTDSTGRVWDHKVKFSLPDKDVFVLDAMANPPRQLSGPGGVFTGVGTILYNMVVNPVSGKVYVSNTDANNLERFEGAGVFTGHSLRGHLHENHITVLTPGGGVAVRHLNKHIDYSTCCAPIPNAENAKSLALPQEMVVTRNGQTLYVAALGSGKIGVFQTTDLENDTFVPSTANQIAVTGGGPSGLVLDEAQQRLYVLTRFDNAISIINMTTRAETHHLTMHNPEPSSITVGRRFLYDASFSSSHGDSACASCHAFGDFDSLAWDLGNPDASVIHNPGPFASALFNLITGEPMPPILHPMKGPMTTQSLRGMANHGPMHWRGDRTGGNDAATAQPDGGTFNERAAFTKFQGGFTELLGRNAFISDSDMQAFTDFIMQIIYPPNPHRPLNNVLTPTQEAGRQLFDRVNCGIPQTDACLVAGNCPVNACSNCHTINPQSNPQTARPGFFGTTGNSSFGFIPQLLKIPHLRNVYQKVGMFGNPSSPVFLTNDTNHQGDQVRGFGILHDGAMDTVFRFVHGISFSELFVGPNNGGLPVPPQGEDERRQLEAFVHAFPTNLAPSVGQQITLTPTSAAVAGPRIDLLIAQANAGACELIVKGQQHGHGQPHEVGFVYLGSGLFQSDQATEPLLTDAMLRQHAGGTRGELTYTCVPPGSGRRLGVDRDGDGVLDGDERQAGSNPADPASTPRR